MTDLHFDTIPAPLTTLQPAGDSSAGGAPAQLDADMKHVLDVLGELGARPLEYSTPSMARRQPRLADAVASIISRQNRSAAEDGVAAEEFVIPNGDVEPLGARLYRPLGLLSRLNPMVLYFHGGGFVTGDLDSHDTSARAIARRTGAIVVSIAYRLAPEHRFPAAHEDSWTVWTWLLEQAHELGGDPRRIAVAGEDAGANLAANIAIRARNERTTRPIHQGLIHPMAGSDWTRESYGQFQRARPIGLAAMRWRYRQLLEQEGEINDPRVDLLAQDSLRNLAPATIILAEADPLRSEGEALAQAFVDSGTPVECRTYAGVTQGFFGLGQLVTKALFAQTDLAQALGRAFAPSS
ncbi:alpha/beta hydrolase [Devosia submarina]|uniref:alpha/beta hydrolase n=1 Tax=Devosia submarina TaxID=1173082 RepID=UPI000D3BE0A3|nr:alpha/beta hydrolase [Devosia submarina]